MRLLTRNDWNLAIHWGYSPQTDESAGLPVAAGEHRISTRLVIAAMAIALLGLAALAHLLGVLGAGVGPPRVGLLWATPFAALLLAIALLPIIAVKLWDRFYGFFAVGLGVAAAIAYGIRFNAAPQVAAGVALYVQFMSLLGSLFVISSGLVLRVSRPATPAGNVLLLAFGSLLANLLGTTGAAIVLIRPYLRMNQGRLRPWHVVFFVFLVANIGGGLTPLGDPPLLLGYLRGMPFWWMLENGWGAWLLAVALLLAMFYLFDKHSMRHAASAAPASTGSARTGLTIEGSGQILLIAVVTAGLFLPSPWREMLMILAAGVSLLLTPERIRHEHRFSFKPLWEMGVLFLGIFLTMTPVLNMLAHSAGSARWNRFTATPGRCYFVTGALSSVLDSAPAYLAAVQSRTAQVAETGTTNEKRKTPSVWRSDTGTRRHDDTAVLIRPTRTPQSIGMAGRLAQSSQSIYLLAISLGAVFFGAMTWIGNGPNLIIKSMAEHAGVRCPGMLAYIVKYALPILLPILVLVWLIFLWAG